MLTHGERGDVRLRKSHVRHQGYISNIPYRYKLACWHEWGYVGTGPFDLGMNILYHFTGEEHFSRSWCKDFVCEVLAPLPHRQSVSIPLVVIENWIAKREGREIPEPFEYGNFAPPGWVFQFGGFDLTPPAIYVD